MKSALIILGFGVAMAAGCASAPPNSPANRMGWIAEHGGPVSGPLQARADAALARLTPVLGTPSNVRVHVLGSDSIGAFSWPDGNLFVHRRLVQVLSDEELSAAFAHELGHLLNDGHLHGVESLRGCSRSLDNEARADARGVEVLRSSGIDPAIMGSMLSKVRDLLPDEPECRRALSRRIDLLATAPR